MNEKIRVAIFVFLAIFGFQYYQTNLTHKTLDQAITETDNYFSNPINKEKWQGNVDRYNAIIKHRLSWRNRTTLSQVIDSQLKMKQIKKGPPKLDHQELTKEMIKVSGELISEN